MRRFRIPRTMAIAVAVLATIVAVVAAAADVLAVPVAGHSAHAAAAHGGAGVRSTVQPGVRSTVLPGARSAVQPAVRRAVQPAVRSTTARDAIAAQTVADVAAAGGLCSVPGIGDIGGLLGFCALGSSGLTGELNNICQPSLPEPEPANSGIDSMVAPPATGKQAATLYDEYGVAGDYWAATNLQCSDMTSLIGNNVAGMVFDAAKSIDRVTITAYQSAASGGILSWLERVADTLITSLGKAIYFPYLAVVVIIAAIWLAWQGLIRKRGTRTIEGTIWMVVACAAAIFLIGKPAAVTGVGTGISDGISQALNAAFAKLPSPGPSSCVPVSKGDPQIQPASYSYVSGSTVVDQNADELFTVLVCKPWLAGEFGTSDYTTGTARPTLVNTYGRSLLWAQAIAINEKPTSALISAKQAAYAGIASSLESNDPAIYPLFQGNQWTTRLEIAFAALFAAIVAGVLVLLISVTLILLKLSFLLLLIVGPFFLLIGTHPGFGRVVALRWVEMLIGVLLKQAAIALVLSLLLYCYALIMGTSDAVLPWALKILMIALVSVAAFIYRKPFQHLFSAVGYGMIGSGERAGLEASRAGATARANSVGLATAAMPSFAAYRAGRWARRNPEQAAGLAAAAGTGGPAGAAAAAAKAARAVGGSAKAAGSQAGTASGEPAGVSGLVSRPSTAESETSATSGNGTTDGSGARAAMATRANAWAAPTAAPAEPPPLRLPSRGGASGAAGRAGSAASRSGSSRTTTGGSAPQGVRRPGVPPPRRAPAAPPPSGRPAAGQQQAPGQWRMPFRQRPKRRD
jgi:hypothetical protein